jgi:membrane protein
MKSSDEKIPLDESPAVTSIWRLGGLNWRTLATRVWNELYAGGLLTHAAALSFYFLFALFPLLIFLVTLLGFFVDRGSDLRSSLFGYLRRLVPSSAFVLINTTLDDISTNAGGARLSLGLLAALWFASLGIAALSESLNAMYGVKESRPWWRVRASAVVLTTALVVLILGALLLIVYGGEIGSQIADYFDQGTLFATLWTIVQIPLAVVFVLLAFAMVYYFAPDLYDQKWYWITPGSIIGVALWLIVSAVLRIYLRYADSYSVTYGSLGGVIILMLWFYVTGVAILLGGKMNAEIESAAARSGVPEAKHHGEKDAEE